MERKDLMPDSTKAEIVGKLIREQDVVRANEQDHDTAVLVRKLRAAR
jgi:hypothetical protein